MGHLNKKWLARGVSGYVVKCTHARIIDAAADWYWREKEFPVIK